MNFHWRTKWFTLYAGLNRIELVDGVNSQLPDGKHFLMWDFDDTDELSIGMSLKVMQQRYKLPKIYIMSSGRIGCYHAYCFKAFDWEDARSIVAATPYVDDKFVAIGILRGFFTLRYSSTPERYFGDAAVLLSRVPEDVDPYSLESFVTYPKKRR